MKAQEKNVPSKSTYRRFNQKLFSRNCKRMVRRKNRRHKVYQCTKLDSEWDKYQVASKAARKVCRNAHNNNLISYKIDDWCLWWEQGYDKVRFITDIFDQDARQKKWKLICNAWQQLMKLDFCNIYKSKQFQIIIYKYLSF